MPPDPLCENELIADLMGPDPSSPSSDAESDEAAIRKGIADLLFYISAIAAAEKGGKPEFQRLYLAGRAKVAFVFDTATVTLDLPDDVLDDLRPTGAALLEYLEGAD